MAKSETSTDYKNMVNFDILRSQVKSIGEAYQPSNSALLPDSLTHYSESGHAIVKRLVTVTNLWNNAVNERKLLFDPLNAHVTRIIKSLRASGVSVKTIDDAKSHADKIRGHNVGKSKGAKAAKAAKAEGEEQPKSISTSQQSFDSKTSNFGKLVDLLGSLPKYAPNEQDLKVDTLQGLFLQLQEINTTVIAAELELNKARAERDAILYKEESGLVDTGLLVKNYVGSLFDSKAPQYKSISKIRLVNLN